MKRKKLITDEELKEMIETIALQIKQSRKEKNMSQQELAELMGCSLKYVKRMESGDVLFRMNTLVALSQIFQLSFFGFLDDLKREGGK